MKKILWGKKRVEQERFVSFRSYYTYEARFCTSGLGREKGGVSSDEEPLSLTGNNFGCRRSNS